VDAGEVDALLKSSAEVADRLRAAEEKARAARELEKLQLFASASAALHREMLAFQDLAGRLRSAKAVPRSVPLDPAAARPAAPRFAFPAIPPRWWWARTGAPAGCRS